MNVTPIEGTGDIVVEPDWTQTFNDPLEIASAREHWRGITTELQDRNLLAPSNAHPNRRVQPAAVRPTGGRLRVHDGLSEDGNHGWVCRPDIAAGKKAVAERFKIARLRHHGLPAGRAERHGNNAEGYADFW
ncbi:hypothetical protein ACFQ4O_00705 [Methylopila musalis]|uniref:Uncharacterized protein n=1 Tax=Methylopila musalis TaxID=1134781 RepID=A0ABW3Z2Q8_9HYPH